jgi:methylmalonyl-CoA mutase, N-terminal domain
VIPTPDYSELERDQRARVAGVRAKRDASRVEASLTSLRKAAAPYGRRGDERGPLVELIIDAVRVRATVGEIADALRASWGEYRPA